MINKIKFIFLSLLGFIFFLVPIPIAGEKKILMSHITEFITGNYLNEFLNFTLICAWLVLILTIMFIFYNSDNKFMNSLFKSSPLNTILRLTGSFLYLMVMQDWFSTNRFAKIILNSDTGGLMVGEDGLLTTLYITFFIGILALPLLTQFGIVEYIGTLIGPVMVKIFKVPGYSTVDAIASFVGDGTIGIVVTDTQYQKGYYNKREAFIIATSFSVVGISFAAAVAEELGFGDIFPVFYGSILLVTVILAFIIARLPLQKFPPIYYKGQEPKSVAIPKNKTRIQYAYDSALESAEEVKIKTAFIDSIKHIIDIYVGFIPVIMTVGTISLIIAEYTSFFTIISAPLVYVYQLVGYSKEIASQMAPASLAGFADMYLPALFISNSPSEGAKFLIGVLAFTQLVFMSETGMILVKSEIGLNFWDVVKVFLFRTLISIPILVGITKLLVLVGIIG